MYLDLREAFDKVSHKHFREKMGGLRGEVLKRVTEFLSGRQMRTVVKDKKSKCREVSSGVSQGSVLALVLFAAYINVMSEGVTSYMSVLILLN